MSYKCQILIQNAELLCLVVLGGVIVLTIVMSNNSYLLGWYYNTLRERNCDGNPARIVIGKDTRRSSYMFEYSLVAGLTASGADAYLLQGNKRGLSP